MNRRRVAALCLGVVLASGHHVVAQQYAGIRTFLRAPWVTDLAELNAEIAILGVPFDEGTTAVAGSRYGPRELRENSMEYVVDHSDLEDGFYYIDGDKRVLKGRRWADCGDVPVSPTLPGLTFERVTKAVRTILAKKAFPVILGGDHSISFPVVRAYDHLPALTVVHFDAHLDTWDSSPGSVAHSTPMRHIAGLPFVKKLIHIGQRGLANDGGAVENSRRFGATILTSEQIHRRGVEWTVQQIPSAEHIYISLDVDVLDPSITPGTGTWEPGGLTFYQMSDLLTGLQAKGRVVGMDVVEVTPDRDSSGRTAQTAVRLILDLLGAVFH